MGLSEGVNPLAVWRERFRWLTPYYVVSGPLAFTMALAYDRLGVLGLAAFALPPAFMMVSARQYLAHTSRSVEEIRRANDDLETLFVFAGGLAAHAHDTEELRSYAEIRLSELLGVEARITADDAGGGIRCDGREGRRLARAPVRGGRGRAVAPPQGRAPPPARDRVRERAPRRRGAALEPRHDRRTLRSMEAKDYYTGGHTERVSHLRRTRGDSGTAGTSWRRSRSAPSSTTSARSGSRSDPQQARAADDDEWRVMKEHPVISDTILSEIDVHPFVRQIARSSHERLDGAGYPDGLAGDEIPKPARIVLVADAFDALTTDRPYRPGASPAAALEEIRPQPAPSSAPGRRAARGALPRGAGCAREP